MAKLPDIKYLSSTESLGRQDISLPGRIARQQMALYAGMADVVLDLGETLVNQEMADGVAGAQAELQQLKTTLTRDRITDVDSFDLKAGIDYKESDAQGNPTTSVSSHRVMEKVWAEGVREIVGKYTEGMTGGMRRIVREKLAGSVSKMGATVSTQAYKWRMDEINAVAEEQVDKLTKSATWEIKDETKMQISSTYNDMIRSGFMGAEEGMRKIRLARSKVDYHVTSQRLTQGGRTEVDNVEELLARPAEQSGLELTLEQRKALYTQLDARNNRLERNREKTEKLERERFATNVMIDIHENGDKSWNEMRRIVRDTEPAQARLLVTLNQAKKDEAAEEDDEGDDAIYAGLETDILGAGLAPLTEDISPQHMKDALTNKIYQALVDHREGRPGITADQANTLYGRVKEAMQKKMRPIGYGDAKEQLAGYITKGSVANLGMRNNGAQALKYYEAVRDMNNAIRTGVTKDPLAWVEANKHNYLAGTTVDNMTKADIEIAKRFEVLATPGDPTRPPGAGPVDTAATLGKARAAYDAGDISARVYQMTVDYWRDQRAAHMDMLKRRAEQENL